MPIKIDLPKKIYIAESIMTGAGRGVFAKEIIMEGELIEQCPVISLDDEKDRARLRKTGLVNYYFLWGNGRIHSALCLGWGSIYNHSFSPNARYKKYMEDERMDFYALKTINPGEEITVNYNGDPNDKTPLRIPGIPAEAGGPIDTKTPKIISGLKRRFDLVKKLFLN